MSLSQMFNVLGSFSFGSGNDCVIYAIAFATGRSYKNVYNDFGTYAADQMNLGNIPGSGDFLAFMGASGGIDFNLEVGFANNVVFGYSGDLSGIADTFTSGNMAVAYLDYGNGHAVVVTAHDDSSGYYYHAPPEWNKWHIIKI